MVKCRRDRRGRQERDKTGMRIRIAFLAIAKAIVTTTLYSPLIATQCSRRQYPFSAYSVARLPPVATMLITRIPRQYTRLIELMYHRDRIVESMC
jgi:hypothetical protein